MKFKKYIKEEAVVETKLTLSEDFGNPDAPLFATKDYVDSFYAPIKKLIDNKQFEDAKKEIEALEADLNEFEKENSSKKFFKFPKFMIENEKKRLEQLKAQLPVVESVEDMDKRCENCNTLLNDQGTCPKCDDGEEDYGDTLKEELSAREKLMKAFPGVFNFDKPVEEPVMQEELSNKEKLKRAYPELNFDNEPVAESCETIETNEEYDDEYAFEDIEEDRVHSTLYGGEHACCDMTYDDDDSVCIDCEHSDSEDEFDDTF